MARLRDEAPDLAELVTGKAVYEGLLTYILLADGRRWPTVAFVWPSTARSTPSCILLEAAENAWRDNATSRQ
jgi:hypothetical protein